MKRFVTFSLGISASLCALLSNFGTVFAHSGAPGQASPWLAWQADPWLWFVLGGVSLWYARGAMQVWGQAGTGRGLRRYQVVAFGGGMLTLVMALLSPLAHLAHESFAWHMTQHLLLMLVAAPLLVVGASHLAYLWAIPAPYRRAITQAWQRSRSLRYVWHLLTTPASVWLLHSVALWLWHLPRFYEAALRNSWIHAFEHFSFFASAFLFWWFAAALAMALLYCLPLPP
jgi:putative membrane protein